MDKEPLTITLPIYYKRFFKSKPYTTFLVGLNWYRNVHFILNNKVKTVYHEKTAEAVGDRKFGKIKLHHKVYLGRTNTDGPNVRSVIEKYFLDGLVDCGAIEDDNVLNMLGDTSEYFLDRNNPRIEITILPQ